MGPFFFQLNYVLILLNCLISEAGSVSAKLKSALDLPAWDFGVCPSMTNNADQFPSRVSVVASW